MKLQIEQALRVLIGLPLWEAGRVADLEWFHFGAKREVVNRRGSVQTVGTYALHVQCAWHIAGPNGIIVASRDRYYPAGDPYQEMTDFEWDHSGTNRCDERMSQLFTDRQGMLLNVESISANKVGGFILNLSDGYALEVFPDNSLAGELWRLFQPYTEIDHLVVTGQGIEA